jgi:hypothetical protein
MRVTTSCAVPLVVLMLVCGPVPATAETKNCTAIGAVPAVITAQGIYCFTQDLTTSISSGNAIEIQTNNVVLDLNEFKLGGLAAGLGTQASGIRADNRQNITIKNGSVRGFMRGIEINDSGASQGHVVERVRADQNTYVGIVVQGAGSLIRNNQVVATGGSTVVATTSGNAFGIVALGNGPRVLDNDVITTTKQGSGTAWDIFISSATGAFAANNRITTSDRGIDYAGASTGKYRDNLTFDIPSPFLGGTDAGNNN